MTRLDVYWSFRSPYSYLSVDRVFAIKRDYDIAVEFKPVRPIALREPDFFKRTRKQFLSYLICDVKREAERLGLAFSLPAPDPVAMDMVSGAVDADQPIMDALMAWSLAAINRGEGLEFAGAVIKSIWSGTQDWNAPAKMRETLAVAALDFDAINADASAARDGVAEMLKTNEAAQLTYHWGVPLLVLDEEPFFGQDRLDSLRWRLDQKGLRRD